MSSGRVVGTCVARTRRRTAPALAVQFCIAWRGRPKQDHLSVERVALDARAARGARRGAPSQALTPRIAHRRLLYGLEARLWLEDQQKHAARLLSRLSTDGARVSGRRLRGGARGERDGGSAREAPCVAQPYWSMRRWARISGWVICTVGTCHARCESVGRFPLGDGPSRGPSGWPGNPGPQLTFCGEKGRRTLGTPTPRGARARSWSPERFAVLASGARSSARF